MSTNNRRRGSRLMTERRDHYEEITARVVASLEAGTPPWRQSWDQTKCEGPAMAFNAVTGHRYRGVNTIILGMSQLAFLTQDPRWATYKQAEEKGWNVKLGSKSTLIVLYKPVVVPNQVERGEADEGTHVIPFMRMFPLFHASQIEGIPDYVPPTLVEVPWRVPEAAETIFVNSGAVMRIGGEKAFYSPTTDHIQMPPKHAFESAEAWVEAKLHELAHWSGHPSRLNRNLMTKHGTPDYAREELRAEIAMVMVHGELGLSTPDFTNNNAYIAGWLEKLSLDKKEIFRAASDAQKIADFLLAFHPDYAARDAEQEAEPANGDADPATPSTALDLAVA